MKITKAAVAAAFLLALSAAANAADYQYLNAKTNPHWRSDLAAWLAKEKPDPTNVSIGMTADGEVHAYAVQGTFTGIYSIQRLHHPNDRPNNAFRTIMDGGTGRIIGFAPARERRHEPPPPPAGGAPAAGGEPAAAGAPAAGGEPPEEEAAAPSAPRAKFNVYLLTWTKQ